jgi:hypothetical protein
VQIRPNDQLVLLEAREFMIRYEETVGAICCRTDLSRMNAIAAASGLSALQGRKPHLFYLANSGRSVEPEVGEELFAAFQAALDEATTAGTIPSWSLLDPRD